MNPTIEHIKERTILLVKHGSNAYGLATPTSDLDLKGICIMGPEWYLGMHKFEQKDKDWEDDQVRYDIKKFITLAADCNPNIIEVLFGEPEDILEVEPAGQKLLDNRDLFLSLKAKHTFTGYAMAQLKRIKNRKKWITREDPTKPEQKDFVREPTNLKEQKLVEEGTMVFDGKAYKAAMLDYHNFLNWQQERNPKRKELELKYGYDTKHGMHLIRLLRMGKEIITTGQVHVRRSDREELLAIRNGSMHYDELVPYAEGLMQEVDDLYTAYKKGEKVAPIRMEPNRSKIHDLCVETIQEYWKRNGLCLQ